LHSGYGPANDLFQVVFDMVSARSVRKLAVRVLDWLVTRVVGLELTESRSQGV
jgi:hypothetical protein